ncbi:IS5 family transposase [Catenulispora yoronensis]|uniref:IS5 family transposase n=1 Tax=Catenulispora yoronensis TaxID=450799 RepID=A0ABP5H8P2_9ACTN
MTDAQWSMLETLLPEPAWLTGNGGRPESHCRRTMIDALFYLVDNGCKWRALPADFPPWTAVYAFFTRWVRNGWLRILHERLRTRIRRLAGRDPEPTWAAIDSQSVKAAATVGRTERGFDGGKRVNGRKRHLIVESTGLLLHVLATPANAHDTKPAMPLLEALHHNHPGVTTVYADTAYLGALIGFAADTCDIDLHVVLTERTPTGGYTIPWRRWVVERTLAWITTCRRCARDYERDPFHHEAMVISAMALHMTRRLDKPTTRWA